MTYEQDYALMEGHRNRASEEYFRARQKVGIQVTAEKAYDDAYARAWDDRVTAGLTIRNTAEEAAEDALLYGTGARWVVAGDSVPSPGKQGVESAQGFRQRGMNQPVRQAQDLMAPEALRKTIGNLLGDAMNVAVENGANSVSMPDEYVALAVWLCEKPAGETTEPFGYWHQGETYDESEFHLAAESGDVSCENCVKLYTHPAEQPSQDAKDAAKWREHVGKLDALVAFCPTCCEGKVASADMTRDEVIFQCGRTSGKSEAARAAQAQGGAE